MIFFTSDIDWVPGEVIFNTIKIFEKFNVKCNFLSTHKSKILDECNRDLLELGIYPNFNLSLVDGKKMKTEETIDNILSIVLEAKGVKSHGIPFSSILLDIYKNRNNKVFGVNDFFNEIIDHNKFNFFNTNSYLNEFK